MRLQNNENVDESKNGNGHIELDLTDSDSGSDSDASRDESYTPYRNRPEWLDIQPISIKTKTSIMDIDFTSRFEETFSYFRAVLQRDELSERSLALTADCIDLQRSNFSVWFFRRRILRELRHDLKDELDYVDKVIQKEPKNYQVWQHRKTIVEWMRDGSHEKRLTSAVLAYDNKNYHAWQHRQWAIKEFDLWDGEIDFTGSQLKLDVRNNSAWNHRYYVIRGTKLYTNLDWITSELVFARKKIEQCPTNESSWSYLRGLLKLAYQSLIASKDTLEFCDQLYKEKNCCSPHLIAFILDTLREKLAITKSNTDKQRALDLCQLLIQVDPTRSRYYTYLDVRIRAL